MDTVVGDDRKSHSLSEAQNTFAEIFANSLDSHYQINIIRYK